MPRTIIIGYGNVDRADDGVAFHIVRGLRRALGQPELTEDHEGDEILGQEPDSIFVPQLVPELMDIVSAYERIILSMPIRGQVMNRSVVSASGPQRTRNSSLTT